MEAILDATAARPAAVMSWTLLKVQGVPRRGGATKGKLLPNPKALLQILHSDSP